MPYPSRACVFLLHRPLSRALLAPCSPPGNSQETQGFPDSESAATPRSPGQPHLSFFFQNPSKFVCRVIHRKSTGNWAQLRWSYVLWFGRLAPEKPMRTVRSSDSLGCGRSARPASLLSRSGSKRTHGMTRPRGCWIENELALQSQRSEPDRKATTGGNGKLRRSKEEERSIGFTDLSQGRSDI